ncbi:MAG: hypothetical protein J6Z40_09810 [Oscillospiraceae bacterium]|nr:hypothetical protein [Oscillospiraceae bacterium]
MDARSILLAMLPVGITLINYAIIRDMLWGIFLGNKSKKSALKLKGEAKTLDKMTQNYMKSHITKYEKDYKVWTGVKRVMLLLTLAQLIAFTIMIILDVPFWIIAIICGVLVLYNIILFGVMMSKTEGSDNKHDRKGTPWKFEQ